MKIGDKLWKQAERRLAGRFGTQRNWLSRTRGGCEDFTNEDFAVDVKSTIAKKMITIHRKDLEDITIRAKEISKTGLLCFRFKGDPNDYAIMNLDDLMMMKYGRKNY